MANVHRVGPRRCWCGFVHEEGQMLPPDWAVEDLPGSRRVPADDVHGLVTADERAAWLNDDGLSPWER